VLFFKVINYRFTLKTNFDKCISVKGSNNVEVWEQSLQPSEASGAAAIL